MKSKLFPQPSVFRNVLLLIPPFILIALTGCSGLVPAEPLSPTPTHTQTIPPTPTTDWFPATPTPTLQMVSSPTPQATLSMAQEGIAELLIEDDFSNERIWTLSQSNTGNAVIGDQNLTLAVAMPNSAITSVGQHQLAENFFLEVSIENALCQPTDQIGIDFWRQSAGDFYRLLMTCAGQIRLELVQGGVSIVVHDWQSAAQINLDSPNVNRVGLWVNQGIFKVYINDTFQFEEPIARTRSGELGFYARTVSGTAMTIRFSELKIYRVVSD